MLAAAAAGGLYFAANRTQPARMLQNKLKNLSFQFVPSMGGWLESWTKPARRGMKATVDAIFSQTPFVVAIPLLALIVAPFLIMFVRGGLPHVFPCGNAAQIIIRTPMTISPLELPNAAMAASAVLAAAGVMTFCFPRKARLAAAQSVRTTRGAAR